VARKVEEAGRGGLHAHHLLNQAAMQPGNLQRLLAGAERSAMLRFVERVQCGFLPDGWTIEKDRTRFHARPLPGVTAEPIDPNLFAAACRPPMDGSLSAAEYDAARARSVVDNQLHKHTARCRKGGHAGTDDDCALNGARVPHTETTFDDGVLLARLEYANIVFHTPAVVDGLRCNNATFMFAEQSKFALRRRQHELAVAGGTARVSDAPCVSSIAEASSEATEYASKYASKHDAAPRSAGVHVVAASSAEVRAYETQKCEAPHGRVHA